MHLQGAGGEAHTGRRGEDPARTSAAAAAVKVRLVIAVIQHGVNKLSSVTSISCSTLLVLRGCCVRPLFSWSEAELGRDQRTQLEAELRARGLLGNEYAVQQILGLAPPSQHRPDMRSAINLGQVNQ